MYIEKDMHGFFINSAFCNSALVLLYSFINWALNIAEVLLKTSTIIILRHILYLVYLYPCLDLSLFMSYFCDVFFIFSLIFIAVNHMKSLKQTHFFFVHFLEYLLSVLVDNVDEESE